MKINETSANFEYKLNQKVKLSKLRIYFTHKPLLPQIRNQKLNNDIFEHSCSNSDYNLSFKGRLKKSATPADKNIISDKRAQEFFDIFPCRNKGIKDATI